VEEAAQASPATSLATVEAAVIAVALAAAERAEEAAAAVAPKSAVAQRMPIPRLAARSSASTSEVLAWRG
jgi:hypothetical protein